MKIFYQYFQGEKVATELRKMKFSSVQTTGLCTDNSITSAGTLETSCGIIYTTSSDFLCISLCNEQHLHFSECMLNHFSSFTGHKSPTWHLSEEVGGQVQDRRTCNCITTRCSPWWWHYIKRHGAGSWPHAWAPEWNGAGVYRKPPRVLVTVWCVGEARGTYSLPDGRCYRLNPWEKTGSAYIRISLLDYCTYTPCQIQLKPQATLSLFFLFVLFPTSPGA